MRVILFVLLLTLLTASSLASAQETSANFGQGSVIVGFDSRACDASLIGALRYHSANGCLEKCSGAEWTCTTAPTCTNDSAARCILDAARSAGDPQFTSANIAAGVNILGVTGVYTSSCSGPAGCVNIGNVCSDGSVFAGCALNGGTPLFTTRCDSGRTWGGSSCSGTRVTKSWSNGNSTGYTTTNVNGWIDGSANTATLITLDSNSGVGGTQPHQAAQYCADLNIHGQTDWYLPAAAELFMLYVNRAAVGDFDTVSGSWYWSSTEHAQGKARYADFYTGTSAGDQRNDDKVSFNYLRCIRK